MEKRQKTTPLKQEARRVKGQVDTPPIVIEQVLGRNRLKLSDNDLSYVDRSATVTWKIAPGSTVQEITDIVRKLFSRRVLVARPEPQKDSTDWIGKVKPDVRGGTRERYTIKYKIVGDPNEYSYDPVLQANP